MECIEKHRHFQRGMPASSILNFRYFTCLLDKGHIRGGRGDFLENVWYYFVMMQDVRNGNCEEKYFMLWWE